MMRKENAWDVMNFAWSYNPNRNFDITYYRFNEKTGGLFSKMMKKKKSSSSVSWKGTRFMLIPEGITPDNKSSMRVGFLRGGKISEKFGYEIGYSTILTLCHYRRFLIQSGMSQVKIGKLLLV